MKGIQNEPTNLEWLSLPVVGQYKKSWLPPFNGASYWIGIFTGFCVGMALAATIL